MGGGESPICIGEGSVIGRNTVLMGKITIGKNCSITAQSYIQTSSHKNNSPTFEGCDCELYIGDFVWMGIRAVIVPGVTHIDKVFENIRLKNDKILIVKKYILRLIACLCPIKTLRKKIRNIKVI